MLPRLVSLLLAAAPVCGFTLLPGVRCHDDFGQVDGVPSLAACEAACSSARGCDVFSYCPALGVGGCPVAGGCWFYKYSQLPACEANQSSWVSGWQAPASPTPAPTPPADWARAIAAGDMAWSAADPAAVGAGMFPMVGNGFLAVEGGPFVQPFANAWPWRDAGRVHMAGVFNGLSWLDPSHRASLPSLHRIFVAAPAGAPANATVALGGAIDYARGIYFNRTAVNLAGCEMTTIETRLYAHRAQREVLVFEVVASGGPGWAGCTLPVASDVACAGFNDTDLRVLAAGGGGAPAVWAGRTLVAEEPGLPLRSVAIALDAWAAAAPAQLVFTPAQPSVVARGVYRSDLDVLGAATPADVAAAAAAQWTQVAALSADDLRASHEAAWAALHASGGVELTGNTTFAVTLNASAYDILSSVRADWPWMPSPGGLATNGYCGHGFWDYETWMSPVIIVLAPDLSMAITQYRLDRLPASLANAAAAGLQGAMWAWESAATGLWTAPCRTCDLNENHISADIPLSMRKFYYASGNTTWLRGVWPLLNETCRFWECRFQRVDAVGPAPPPGYASGCGWKDGTGNWSVFKVMTPDESRGVINASAYTNAAAAQTLAWCGEAAAVLGLSAALPPIWGEMSASPYLPLSDALFAGGTVHVQNEGYAGQTINQADVALMQYPLGLRFDADLARRDLDYYSSKTDFAGMFTGDSAYACAYLALGNRSAADEQIALAFGHLDTQHFQVFTETELGKLGTEHFITGNGGYLQAFVFGYSGMRIERLGVFSFAAQKPVLPPLGVTAMKLRGLSLLGAKFDFWFDADNVCAALHAGSSGAPLELRVLATGARTALTAEQVCTPLAAVEVAGVGFV